MSASVTQGGHKQYIQLSQVLNPMQYYCNTCVTPERETRDGHGIFRCSIPLAYTTYVTRAEQLLIWATVWLQ